MNSDLNISYTNSQIFPVEKDFLDKGGITGIGIKKHKIFVKRFPSKENGSYDNIEIISEDDFKKLKKDKMDFKNEEIMRINNPVNTSKMTKEEIATLEDTWKTKVNKYDYEVEEIPVGFSNIKFTSLDGSTFEVIPDDNENKIYNVEENIVKTETEEITCEKPMIGIDIYKSKITPESDDIINKIGVICDGQRKIIGYDTISNFGFRNSKICSTGKNITFLRFNGKNLNIDDQKSKMTIVNDFDDIRCYELDKSKYTVDSDLNDTYKPPDYFPTSRIPSFINNITLVILIITILGCILSISISVFIGNKK